MEIPKTVKELAAASQSGKNPLLISEADSTAEEAPTVTREFVVKLVTNKYPKPFYPELTEAEEIEAIEAALLVVLGEAQRQKHIRLKKQEHAAKIKAENHIPGSAEELLEMVMKRGEQLAIEEQWGKDFTLDKHRKPVYTLLSWYFVGDDRFVTEGPALIGDPEIELSLTKGILLAGKRGVGKSVAMELFSRNPYQPYLFVSCEELENAFDQHGAKIIEHNWFNFPTTKPDYYYGHRSLGGCYDDIGAEQNGKHFGKESNFMQKILTGRYRNCRGPYTHLTSNASLDELNADYGERAFDRFRQMFNLIEFSENATNLRL